MKMWKRFGTGVAIAAMMSFAAPAPALRAQDAGTVKQDAKDAGKDAKKAGKETGKAAKDSAKATAKATKKTAKSAKHAANGKTVTARCNDGTTYTGKSRSDACSGHGGVKGWMPGQ